MITRSQIRDDNRIDSMPLVGDSGINGGSADFFDP